MARMAKVDFKELAEYAKSIKRMSDRELDKLCEDCSKELAGRLLALVIPKTPVGKYPKGSGKKGGTLRRGWGGKSGKAGREYAQSLNVTKAGNIYTVEIINPVEYASYVEFGHRTVNGGWVAGQYMLTISEERLKTIAPSALERLVRKKLEEFFNGGN